jgi:hypothetical protein
MTTKEASKRRTRKNVAELNRKVRVYEEQNALLEELAQDEDIKSLLMNMGR